MTAFIEPALDGSRQILESFKKYDREATVWPGHSSSNLPPRVVLEINEIPVQRIQHGAWHVLE